MAYTSHVFYTRYAGGEKNIRPEGRMHAYLPPSAREVARRAGGSEPCRDPKYFGLPGGSLPHPLRREPPRIGGQEPYAPSVWRSISRRSFRSFYGLGEQAQTVDIQRSIPRW